MPLIVTFTLLLWLVSATMAQEAKQCRGCMFEGSCRSRNEKWEDESQCTKYKCLAIRIKEKQKMTIVTEVLQRAYGCPYNNTCMNFTTTWKDENQCLSYKCGKKRPRILGGKYRKRHTLYKLRKKVDGCPFNGECKDIHSKWNVTDKCTQYTCRGGRRRMKDGTIVVYSKIRSKLYGCPFNGECKDIDSQWKATDTCTEYECKRGRKRMKKRQIVIFSKIKATQYGCPYDGECKDVDSKWNETETCTQYECTAGRRKEADGKVKAFSQVKSEKYGCSFMGECRLADEQWKDGCHTRKCIINNLSSKTDFVMKGCKDTNGTCHDENATWVENCITLKCIIEKVDQNSYKITNKNIAFGCPYNNTCLEIDEDVEEDCISKKCLYNAETKTRVVKPYKFGCMDADGKCREAGESGYPMEIKGVRYENCNCTITTKDDGTYSIGKNCKA